MIKMFCKIVVLNLLFLLASSQIKKPSKEDILFENFQIRVLQNRIDQLEQQKLLDAVENVEITKLYRAWERRERVNKYKALVADKKTQEPQVAIIGQSAVELSPLGFDPDKLANLLDFIREDKPQALFLAGNTVYGLDAALANFPKENLMPVNLPPNKNIFKETIEKLKGYYRPEHFKEVLGRHSCFSYINIWARIFLFILSWGLLIALVQTRLNCFARHFIWKMRKSYLQINLSMPFL